MKKLIPVTLLSLPIIASAQAGRVSMLISYFGNIVKSLIPILLGVAVVVFFWGIVQYLFTDAKEKGSKLMFWGIIAIFVMVSIWGLIEWLQTEFLPGASFGPQGTINIFP